MIFKVSSSAPTDWEKTRCVVVRAINNQEAIDLAIEFANRLMDDYDHTYDWTRENCKAILIQENGESTIILEDNMGS